MNQRILYYIIIGVLAVACKSTYKPGTTSKGPVGCYTQGEPPRAAEVTQIASKYIGVKYLYGGTDNNGFDCSGFTFTVFKEMGIILPRPSGEQAEIGKRVYIGELKRGDLIFFSSKPGGSTISHVGIISCVDNGIIKMVHASSSVGVVENPVDDTYWKQRYVRACRPLVK